MVVHFPEYTGLSLLDGFPRTWVPVPCVEVQNKQTRRYIRVGLPLRLAYALTIHKAQGLSLLEGAVVDLQVSNPKRNPVAAMGLACVALDPCYNMAAIGIQEFAAICRLSCRASDQRFPATGEL